MTSRAPRPLLAALLGLLLALLSAPASPRAAAADLRVVATVPDLAAIAEAIGGEHVQVSAMSLGTQDPHFVDARPNLALELSRADLLLLVGLDLEIGWLPNLLTGSRNAAIQKGAPGYLDCSQFVQLLQVPTVAIDRSMGDIHPGGNPHYLYDPRAAQAVAGGIAGQMAALDPAHAAAFYANAQAFVSELDAAFERWSTATAGLQGAPVIGYHNSWPYLADWLGLEVIAFIEPKPGVPPNPAHVAQVIGVATQRNPGLILQEGYYPTNTSELIAARIGARVVSLPGGADLEAGQRYQDRIDAMVAALVGEVP